MVGRPRFLHAVRRAGAGAATAALMATVSLVGVVPSAHADRDTTKAGSRVSAPVRPKAARARAVVAPDTAPLRVQILHLSPSTLPVQGKLTVRGVVTNRSDEVWTSIKLYAFLGDDRPAMTTRRQLAAALEEPYESFVGERIVNEGTEGLVETLEPGASAPFEVVVPAASLQVVGGGVYWFGVHALGQSDSSPRDDAADGRARTFLPYVPPRVTTPVKAALVLPLIKTLRYRGDGALDEETRWTRALSPQGRLRDLLAFATAPDPDMPVSWVVDPALLDGIRRLSLGNQPHSLGPSERRDGPEASATPTGSATPSDTPTAGSEPDEEQGDGTDDGTSPDASALPPTPLSRAASAWLGALPDALADNEVLTLPYGNIDVPAALLHDPKLLDVALAQRSKVLADLDVEPTSVLTSPGGFLDTATIDAADDDATLLVSEALVPDTEAPVVQVDGHELVVASAGAGQGSPGPGPSITSVGLRQRILAEAAIRALRADQPALTVVLPTKWALDDASDFFRGLDVDWLDVVSLSELRSGSPVQTVPDDGVAYPLRERRRQLDPATFVAADRLVASAESLQRILGDNNEIAGLVTEQALAELSYNARRDQVTARARIAGAQAWVDGQLSKVSIAASAGVTLASDSGTFVVTLSNDLDQAVTVSVRATTDAGLDVTDPEPVQLAPGTRTNVLLEAHATSNKVHNVTLMVTDADGVPLGPSDELPIRSTQVSDVIWVIMGGGVAILFVAIGIRLVRRVRGARRGARLESA